MDGGWIPAKQGADTSTQSVRKIRVEIETLVDMNRAKMIKLSAREVTL